MQDQRQLLVVQAAALIATMYAFIFTRLVGRAPRRPQITYAPMSAMDEERQRNLRLIYDCNDVECVNMLRMRRAPFFHLCTVLRERNLLRDSIHSSVEEQVAMFLHVVGHNQRFRVVHQTWRRSVETVSRYFKEVLFAIGELRNEMIRPPSTDTPLKIRNSPRWYPFLKDCLGAIDGTHIYARVSAKIQSAFRGRKNYPTQNVLVACDFDMKFTYVPAGWEGSAHDATVLVDALQRHDGLNVPEGMAWYVVTVGRQTGVFPTWEACHAQVQGFSGACYKKCKTKEEAIATLHGDANVEARSNNNTVNSDYTGAVILLQAAAILVLSCSVLYFLCKMM